MKPKINTFFPILLILLFVVNKPLVADLQNGADIASKLTSYLLDDDLELSEIFLDSLKKVDPNSARLPLLEAIFLLRKGKMSSRIRANELLANRGLKKTDPFLYYFARGVQFKLQNRFEGAIKSFRKALEINPTSVPILYELAQCHYQLFLQDLHRYSSSEVPISFRDYAIKEYQEGITLLNRAISYQFNSPKAWRLLGLFYLELGDYPAIVHQIRQAREVDSTNVVFNLLLGIAHFRQGEIESSQKYFDTALSHMNSYLAKIYRSPQLLITKISRQLRVQSPDRFWALRDPFYLTPENERFLEHLSRIAYVDLRFGIPERQIPGWDTDRGRIYLKFGPPKQIIFYHQTVEDNGTIYPATEIWRYPKFEFMFEDAYWNRNFTLAQPELNPTDHSALRSRATRNYQLTAEEVLNTYRELYQFTTPKNQLTGKLRVYQFGDSQNRTLVWIPFQIDLSRLKSGKESLQLGLFWWVNDPLSRKQIVARKRVGELLKIEQSDTLWGLEAFEFPIEADSIHFSLEGWAKKSDLKFIRRGAIRIRDYTQNSLQISDLVLAYAPPPGKNQLSKPLKSPLIPNVLHTYSLDETMQVYFEIYHLKRDENGTTHYKVETAITPLKGSFWGSLFGGKKTSVTIENIYQGNNSNDFVNFAIRLAPFKNGTYAVKIVVTDLISEQVASGQTEFIVQSASKKLSRK